MRYLICILLLCGCTKTADEHDYITLENAHFELVTDSYFTRKLDFETLPSEQKIYLTYWGAIPTIEFKYGLQSLSVVYRGHAEEKVLIAFNNQIKSISFIIQGEPAQYTESYIQQHSGKVTAVIPEVFELANIVLALADKFHQTNYGSHSEGDYYLEVIKWFAPFKDHALFGALENVDYYSFVDNGPAYMFDNDEIKPSPIYNGFRAKDSLADNLTLLQDFAKTSDFRAFYQQQQPYYLSLTNKFLVNTQPLNIWQWLESQFPARYQSYKVFFSPLGAGRHSARMYSENDFKETLMFISGPNRYEIASDPASLQALKLSRTFFTEIDHAYVNPVSDNYIKEINAALPDLTTWYQGGGYNKPYSTFNEYMTWSVFLLYAMDTYSEQDYVAIKAYVDNFMTNKRGFYKFKAFNQQLTLLYQNRSNKQTIVDLYPAIIRWVAAN